MKSLLLVTLLPLSLFGQKKKETVYFKLAPSMVFQKEQDPKFGGFASLDGKFGHYIVAGISGGYIKLQGWQDPVIPLGLDFNFASFDKGKISPVGSFGIYYPITDTRIDLPGLSYEIKGKFFYHIGGGLSITGTHSKKQKLFLTGSFSQLVLSNAGRPVTGVALKKNETVDLFILSMSFML